LSRGGCASGSGAECCATDISTFGSLGWYLSRGGNPDRKMAAWAIVNDLELDAAAGVLVGDFTGDGHEDILARRPL
jgi:hypothetical protein